MSMKLYLFLLTCAVLVAVSSADIFGDLFKWDLSSVLGDDDDDDDDAKGKREDDDGSPQSNCDCEGPKCNCCVDFNISSIIDLGGPGCVTLKYISKTKGVALNVSYGDSILHSQTVTDEKKKGTCMPLLSDLAQICARFAALTSTDDGLTGCLNFEPTVLGEVTSQYHVGCFKMGPEGMVVEKSANFTVEAEEESPEEESPDEEEDTSEKPEVEAQSFIEAVNQSAEEGLAFFTNLLGFSYGTKKTNTTSGTTEKSAEVSSTTETAKRRKGKFGIYSNLVQHN